MDGSVREVRVPVRGLGSAVSARVWSPADASDDEPLPLLLAHDGPEYDERADLTAYAAAMVAAGRLPRHRIALLAPGDRNAWYSANTAYAAGLCLAVVPALSAEFAVRGRPAGMGASLGALAMLHAQRRYPGTFGGLFLQSGSYFVPVYDHMEAGFDRFGRIVRWVSATRRATHAAETVPVVLTCGTFEENLRNNRLMGRALTRQRYPVRLVEAAGVHDWSSWRSCFDPYLTDLLAEAWRAA
ncbi:MAG: enterochelin esterase [Streptosporangiales bacterium]|nr:enterochelin esterase [Streptosporangiales bacterium]